MRFLKRTIGVVAIAGGISIPGPANIAAGQSCTIEQEDNCQFSLGTDGWNWWSYADADAYGGHEVADDFIPEGVLISGVCVEGVYTEAVPKGYDLFPCALATEDEFEVRVYENDPVTNLPDKASMVATTATIVTKAPMLGTDIYYRLQLSLDNPITVVPGACHWISVTNNTRGPERYPPEHKYAGQLVSNMCHFFWLNRVSVGEARDGNDYAATKYTKYGDWTPRAVDYAFCLDIPFEAGGCGVREGACCDNCAEPDPVCTFPETLNACDALDRGTSWESKVDCEQKTCEPMPDGPPGDMCFEVGYDGATHECINLPGKCLIGGAECNVATDCPGYGNGCICQPNGPILIAPERGIKPWIHEYQGEFTNNCADTDGPNPTVSETGVGQFVSDIWVEYVVPGVCDGGA